MRKNTSGFTIVELLIVIVVIGILAAITLVAYGGVKNRAADTKRISDMNSIMKALEYYKISNGAYPNVSYSGLGSQGGWESSARENQGQFLHELVNYGLSGGVPVDPINDGTDNTHAPARAAGRHTYVYYVYAAGNAGCDANRGRYYVIGFIKGDSYSGSTHPNSPGFSCSGRNWQTELDWVSGGYEK